MQIISDLNEFFHFAGIGEESIYFSWSLFNYDDFFWIIPHSRCLAVANIYNSDIRFYDISEGDFSEPPDYEVGHNSFHDFELEIDFAKVSPDEIIHRYGKKYKFLVYNLDLIK